MSEVASKRVWLVDEGSHGHRVQAQGILEALREHVGWRLDVATLRARARLPGFWRPLARAALDAVPTALAARCARLTLQGPEPDGPLPDFIISSGGTSAFASRALALRTRAPNVFVGEHQPFPDRWFRVVMPPLAISAATTVILTGVVPSTTTPASARAAAESFFGGAIAGRVWTLLVGGTSRSHRYADEDVEALAAGVNALAARYGVRWLVTSSRRTGARAEAILERMLKPPAVDRLILFGREPKPVALAFLGAAERAFVTQDSLTMLSEAVASGRPVVALAPARVTLPPTSIDTRLVAALAALEGFERRRCGELERYVPRSDALTGQTIAADALARAAHELAAVLEPRA